MIYTSGRIMRVCLVFACLLGGAHTTLAQEVSWSTLSRYQMYIVPWISQGTTVGVQVYYSVGALQDTGGPSGYAAVCVGDNSGTSPCVNPTSHVWVRTALPSVGSWVVQNIPVNCAANLLADVQVLQPYVAFPSSLYFAPWGTSPYQGAKLFYSGSADTVMQQIVGCSEVAR